jgi:hypothetical protein
MSVYTDYASQEILDWLLVGDPAVRWQVQRDLLDQPAAIYEAERARVATEGWGARYLVEQDAAGTWSQALYSPKWVSTHYTLLTLLRIGLPPDQPQAVQAARILLDSGFLDDHGINFSDRKDVHAETCISGMCLNMLSYFAVEDERIHQLAAHMVEQQMEDDGWNCRSYRGDTHSSFHTSASALEGLLAYQQKYGEHGLPLAAAQAAGREFLLQHRLYKSHRSGEIVKDAMTRGPFPPFWQYDFMRALDHFQAAEAERDSRAQDAIDLLVSKRDSDGYWPAYRGPSGKYWFQMEAAGRPSRWNTLRALRILRWWYGE